MAAFAADLPADAVVLGHGWDESGWSDPAVPDAAELDRAAGGRRVYLSQASMHSALVSSALLAACPQAVRRPGTTRRGGCGATRTTWCGRSAQGSVSAGAAGRRRSGWRCAHAASLGIAAVHECGGPEISDEEDFTGLLAHLRRGVAGGVRVLG